MRFTFQARNARAGTNTNTNAKPKLMVMSGHVTMVSIEYDFLSRHNYPGPFSLLHTSKQSF